MTSASDAAVGGVRDPEPGRRRLFDGRRTRTQPDPHVDTRVAQIEGVRVPLRPIANYRHFARRNNRRVSIAVVVDGGHLPCLSVRLSFPRG